MKTATQLNIKLLHNSYIQQEIVVHSYRSNATNSNHNNAIYRRGIVQGNHNKITYTELDSVGEMDGWTIDIAVDRTNLDLGSHMLWLK